MKITEHFWWTEAKVSESYPSIAQAMILTAEQKRNCFLLASFALEIIRRKYGRTIITSWARNEDLNWSVGGSKTSQHLTGGACDFICTQARNMKEVFEFLNDELRWPGQLFYYPKKGHVHIGLPRIGVAPTHKYLD